MDQSKSQIAAQAGSVNTDSEELIDPSVVVRSEDVEEEGPFTI
ncbi:hypothetical protein GCM10010387_03990 [Streptomyces inusitatus]|uniref:Uncharacterized protein n=1 Tax=Streptomyces inusitatus TaxID=68221 RepID=A0A918PMN5_9ACTN|nr:hypothetical protein [Streptomyces inusitatus]GGZ14934.1 hypothetical protein GCM10010387_03990 [Streptomyces inusitatus]